MDLEAHFRRSLAPLGLDLVVAFDASRYNEAIGGHQALQPLPLFGREGAAALLVGNTKALWAPFTAAYRRREDLQEHPHPLDAYVMEAMQACAATVPSRSELHFSHEGGPRLVSMLHAAKASGFAKAGPAYLAAHPAHGTWVGLRAVVVFDEAPQREQFPGPTPCEGCPAPCKEALDEVLAQGKWADDQPTWRGWVAVRDACPVGRQSRYGEAQLRYHYTKDRRLLG